MTNRNSAIASVAGRQGKERGYMDSVGTEIN